jgi:hypothetical protein
MGLPIKVCEQYQGLVLSVLVTVSVQLYNLRDYSTGFPPFSAPDDFDGIMGHAVTLRLAVAPFNPGYSSNCNSAKSNTRRYRISAAGSAKAAAI